MRILIKLCAFLLISINTTLCLWAQEVELLPVQIDQFYNSYSIINPASNVLDAPAEIQIGTQRHPGIWKNISTSFLSGAFRIKGKKQANSHQFVGLSFHNDKEGEYLKRSRLYLNYGYNTKLSSSFSLSAGLSIGVCSYSVSGTNISTAGSATSPDGTLGMWLNSERFYLGVSINQILNSKLTPLEETTKLIRHFNLTSGYTYKPSPHFTIAPRFLLRYTPGLTHDIDFSLTSVIKGIVGAGFSYRYKKALVPVFGIEKIAIGSGDLKVMFSYSTPLGKIASNIRNYELIMNYRFKPLKK